MKTSEVAEHFTPLDRSVLDGENAYQDYFKYLKFALEQFINSVDNYQGDAPYEANIIKSMSQKFLNSIEVLSLKYAFNDTHPMLVDLTESGFPNHMEFRRLADDLTKQAEELKDGQSVDTLRTLILDHMIRSKTEPVRLLKQISKRTYFETLDTWKLFKEFTSGPLELLSKGADFNWRYLYSWGSFDSVTNRPYIYMLVFDHHREDAEAEKALRSYGFVESIRKITHNTAPLKVMISDIDSLSELMMPKVLKRIAIGPIYGEYSQDEHPFSKMLKKRFDYSDFIFRYDAEVIFSVGQQRKESFLTKGELRQIFYIDESNKECMEKMISKLNKYSITSHGVWQYLSEYHPEALNELVVPPYIYHDN
ncbi:MAG: hypothetical protein K9J17_13475 [Flavobacteriales bacterium]|nr:hypothetical protein [Flavobacteriales bacterium]